MAARVQKDEPRSLAWLNGWAAQQYRGGGAIGYANPYDPVTQAFSYRQWCAGWQEREARVKAGTVDMVPCHDLPPMPGDI